jgi:nitrite reductase/ring-hydroxylating ferredoxin subunit
MSLLHRAFWQQLSSGGVALLASVFIHSEAVQCVGHFTEYRAEDGEVEARITGLQP